MVLLGGSGCVGVVGEGYKEEENNQLRSLVYRLRAHEPIVRCVLTRIVALGEQKMTDFGSSLPTYKSHGNDSARVMDQVRSQIAVASAQELIQVS